MKPIPLPSPIHYELPLRVLEQQTLFAVAHHQQQREIAHELVITLRKALSLQKRLEESCDRDHLEVDYRWALEALGVEPAALDRSEPHNL